MKLRLLMVFVLPLALLAAGQKADRRKAESAAKPKQAAKVVTLKIPAGAVETEPGTWRHVDAKGKAWLYRNTPFGVTRSEEQAAVAAAPAIPKDEIPGGLKAVEDGDSIRFERPSPFGPMRWTKKKTDDLSETERLAWERDRPKAADSQPPAAPVKPEAGGTGEIKPDVKE